MIYELKQKIRHSRAGEVFAKFVEKTPLFPFCYWVLWVMGLSEPKASTGQTKEDGQKYFGANEEKIKKIVSLLADEKSKEVFLKNIKLRSIGFWFMRGTPQDQYFPKDIVQLSEEEVFIDCGAYNGDTIAKFRQSSRDRYKKIVAFEPLEEQAQKILAQNNPRCEVLPYGAWNEKGEQIFYLSDMCSKVGSLVKGDETPAEKTTIQLEKIDNLETCSQMTFLKMDIEGAELNALKGAEQTIRRQRPKLAICIYHSNEDMLEIPLWVASLDMGYKLYVRHHEKYSLADTVLYAV